MIADRAHLANRGTVVADWHMVRGRRQGPYYRLIYHKGRVKQAIYLGRSEELVQQVRDLLAEFQTLRRAREQRRRLWAYIRRQLRDLKARHRREMAAFGVVLEGWEPASYAQAFQALRTPLDEGRSLSPIRRDEAGQ
jgi:hypothetical protein